MTVLIEGRLRFDFGTSCQVNKYDEWSFYRNQFQNTCGGTKAVDMVCLSHQVCWLIEIKDYRENRRTKPQDLGNEVAVKVRDTMAGLMAAKMLANIRLEKDFAEKATRSKFLKVVLHLEQPEKHSRLRPHAIDLAAVKQSLKRQLKAIDAHPCIVNQYTISANMAWTVAG